MPRAGKSCSSLPCGPLPTVGPLQVESFGLSSALASRHARHFRMAASKERNARCLAPVSRPSRARLACWPASAARLLYLDGHLYRSVACSARSARSWAWVWVWVYGKEQKREKARADERLRQSPWLVLGIRNNKLPCSSVGGQRLNSFQPLLPSSSSSSSSSWSTPTPTSGRSAWLCLQPKPLSNSLSGSFKTRFSPYLVPPPPPPSPLSLSPPPFRHGSSITTPHASPLVSTTITLITFFYITSSPRSRLLYYIPFHAHLHRASASAKPRSFQPSPLSIASLSLFRLSVLDIESLLPFIPARSVRASNAYNRRGATLPARLNSSHHPWYHSSHPRASIILGANTTEPPPCHPLALRYTVATEPSSSALPFHPLPSHCPAWTRRLPCPDPNPLYHHNHNHHNHLANARPSASN